MVTFWVTILALSMLLYVLLDGFDLGVGILFGVIGGDTERRLMMGAVEPVWDGNETWLVVTAVVLWGAFPIVYSILLSAFYLPLFLMLAGLILRGVAFEYRAKTQGLRWVWDAAFAGGSLVAAFMQGLTVGSLVEGLPVAGTLYTGGAFTWLSPFALLCGVGLCIGYALLGACWLVKKCDGDVRETAYRLIPLLSIALLVFLIVVFIYALAENLQVMHRWLERPILFIFPIVGALASLVLALNVIYRRDNTPFYMVALIFSAAFGTLAISFWPYIDDRERSRSTLQPCLHVLGRWSFRLSSDAGLHCDQLLRFSWEGQSRWCRLLVARGCRLSRLAPIAPAPHLARRIRRPPPSSPYFFSVRL